MSCGRKELVVVAPQIRLRQAVERSTGKQRGQPATREERPDTATDAHTPSQAGFFWGGVWAAVGAAAVAALWRWLRPSRLKLKAEAVDGAVSWRTCSS